MATTKSIQAALIIRCITAAISASASSLLIFFILVDYATTGLKSPYSRIIFGLSFADVLQSLGILLSPFAAPTDPTKHIFGVGNEQSCDAIGFFTVMGSLAVPLYTLHLTYYFLKRVKYKVKPSDFANGEEKWLHIFIWVYSISVTIFSLAKGQINATQYGASCFISTSPLGCEQHDDQVCIRGEGARKTNALAVFVLLAITFVALFYVLGAFSLYVYRSEKQLQPTKVKAKEVIALKKKEPKTVHRNILKSCVQEKSEEEESTPKAGPKYTCLTQEPTISYPHPPLRQKSYNRKSEISNENQDDEEAVSDIGSNEEKLSKYAQQAIDLVLTKSAIFQSSLYIIAFIFIYSGLILGIIIQLVSRNPYQIISDVIFCWVSITYPLGGLLNMIIYTRPKVKALQKVVPELSNFMSFIAVLMSGGETPNVLDIMETSNENNINETPSRSHHNSRLDRVLCALGFEERDNLYEEMENAMIEDYIVHPYIEGLYEEDGISLDDDNQDYNILGARNV